MVIGAPSAPINALCLSFFFFNDTSPTEIYTLSLHDALPISDPSGETDQASPPSRISRGAPPRDRKSTRLNSSHRTISYAVFCLKKKKYLYDAYLLRFTIEHTFFSIKHNKKY